MIQSYLFHLQILREIQHPELESRLLIWYLCRCYCDSERRVQDVMTTSEEIVDELRRRVTQRRQEGKYPVGLERQLEAEFKNIMDVVHRGTDVLGEVERLLDQCRSELLNLQRPISAKSRFPGFALVHWVIGKIVGRQIVGISSRVQVSLETQQAVLELLLKQLEIQQGNDVRVLNQLSHAMKDRLMMVDVLAQAVIELERKVSRDS